MVACLRLLDTAHPRWLWRVRRADFWVFAAAFFFTLVFGVLSGILIAALLSVLRIIKRVARPNWARLGRLSLPGETVYRDVLRFPEAELLPGVEILRFDAGLSFVNVAFLGELLEDAYLAAPDSLRALVLECTAIVNIDSTALEELHAIHELFASRGVDMYWATVRGPVRDVFAKHGTTARFGVDRFFLSLDPAVRAAVAGAVGSGASSGAGEAVGDEQL